MRNSKAFVAVRKSDADGEEYYDIHSVADTKDGAGRNAREWAERNKFDKDPVVRVVKVAFVPTGG